MKNLFYIITLFFTIPFSTIGQESMQLIEKHFVKENRIIFRIVPTSKNMFELIKTNSIKVTRYDLSNNIISNEKIIEPMLNPYWEADTLNWMRLIRKDKNKAGFIYNAIFQKKSDPKLTVQQKDKQEKMVYDLMLLSCDFDSEIAKACGLFFIDSTIVKGTIYKYSFSVYANPKSLITNEKLSVNINTSLVSNNKQIENLSCKSKNKISALKWKAVDYKSDYSGYYVERSEDSIHFKKVNKAPIILLSTQFEKNKEYIFYNDTMPEVNKKYFYRIKGINFFGEDSSPSNIVSAYCSPIINSIPLIDSIVVVKNREVKIRWRMEDKKETKLPKTYVLMRSEKDNGIYKILFASKEILEYTDINPTSSNFYKVGAITINGDTIYSYSRMATIIDTIPPTVPIDMKATVDAKGNVTICWKKNKEQDMQGYKLFKANALSEEFVQLNNKFINDTFYRVSRKSWGAG
ncbi:MAG: hypothetical protein H0W73_17565 [Bacteroidetes bacterium]|nr:hypothetical protein [Bacteroidota bacterium]